MRKRVIGILAVLLAVTLVLTGASTLAAISPLRAR